MTTPLTPLSALQVESHLIPSHASIPNTSLAQRPLLIYRSAFPPTTTPSQIEQHLKKTGIVTPQWRYTMFPYSHFHSNTHEVLCISSGSAKLCFGHEENPGKVEASVRKGDVVVVPAGVAHRLVEGEGFEMVGAYPKGKGWDMCYGGEKGVEERVRGVDWFGGDPVYGERGPVLDV